MEDTPLARTALDQDAAAHQLDQPETDGQSQSGAAVSARDRGIGLGKGSEDLFQLFRCHPDAGVCYTDMDNSGIFQSVFKCYGNADASLIGKLDGIAQQVEE